MFDCCFQLTQKQQTKKNNRCWCNLTLVLIINFLDNSGWKYENEMIIKRINNWFVCDFYPMRWFARLFIARPKQAWEVKTKFFLGLEENSITSCPALERILMTISSIWCRSWKSTHTTPVRFSAQSSVLGSSIDTPTPWAHNVSTPSFHPNVVENSPTYCL